MKVEIKGIEFLFDDEDWAWVGLFLLTVVKLVNGNNYLYFKRYAVHRMIYKFHNGEIKNGNVIDHINRISTDNRSSNLRQISNYQNLQYNRKKKRGTSEYIGVSKDRLSKKWRSQHHFNGENIHLGLYDSEYEAAIAHDLHAVYYYENPLRLNFPEAVDGLKLMIGLYDSRATTLPNE